MLPSFEYKTNTRIDTVTFSEHNILSIIRSLNQNKAHGWDNVSTRMIKICDDSIILPLAIIFKTALNSGIYPEQWKKANVVPVHKKDSKNLLKNYRLFVERFLKNVFMTHFIPILNQILSFLHVNQVFVKKIPVFHSYLP